MENAEGHFDTVTLTEDGRTAAFTFADSHCFGIPGGDLGVHGGCIMGLCVQSTLKLVARMMPQFRLVMTSTGSFLSAPTTGPCQATMEVLKQTKNYCHVLTRLEQASGVFFLLSAVLGVSFNASSKAALRASSTAKLTMELLSMPPPKMAPVDSCTASCDTDYWSDGSRYGCHVDLLLDPSVERALKKDEHARLNAWVRMRNGNLLTFASGSYIADFMGVTLKSVFHTFRQRQPEFAVWDATLSMVVHWHQDPSEGANEWHQLSITSRVITLDRHEFEVVLWRRDGSLIFTSSQLQVLKVLAAKL